MSSARPLVATDFLEGGMETDFRDDFDRARPCASYRRCWTGDPRAGVPGSGGARAGPPADVDRAVRPGVLAAYDVAGLLVRKGAILRREGLYASHMWTAGGPGTARAGRRGPASGAVRRLTRGMRRSPGCRIEKS